VDVRSSYGQSLNLRPCRTASRVTLQYLQPPVRGPSLPALSRRRGDGCLPEDGSRTMAAPASPPPPFIPAPPLPPCRCRNLLAPMEAEGQTSYLSDSQPRSPRSRWTAPQHHSRDPHPPSVGQGGQPEQAPRDAGAVRKSCYDFSRREETAANQVRNYTVI
jgi:hypothetical protein